MSKHVYVRAYMAGIAMPTVFFPFVLVAFVAVHFGYGLAIPIERVLVFPLALVPCLWGLWNMLYVLLRQHRRIPLGLHGAIVPLLVGPLALLSARLLGFEIPPGFVRMFPLVVVLTMAIYYLVWKYVVRFFNELAGIE